MKSSNARPERAGDRRAHPAIGLTLVAIAYFVLSQAGQAFATIAGGASLVWPAAGLALGAVMLGGPLYALAVAVGACVGYMAIGGTALAGVMIGCGSATAALSGAALLRRFGDFSPRLGRVRDVYWLAGFGAVVSTMLAATFGALALVTAGVVPRSTAGSAWLTWWGGDALGVLLITPVLLVWAQRPRPDANTVVAFAAGVAISGIVFLGSAILRGVLPGSASQEIVAFALLPLAIGPALRLGMRDIATLNLVVSLGLIAGTAAGMGPFAAEFGRDGMVAAHAALIFVALTTLIVCAASTERRAAIVGLAESEARFRSLTELSNDWYWEQDEALRYTRFSRGFGAATGIDPHAWIGRKCWELPIHSAVEPRWREHKRQVEARLPFRDFLIEYPAPDGRRRSFLTSGEPVFTDDGQFQGYRGVARDITAQRLAEERLRESEERYASVFHSSAAAIFTMAVSEDGEFRFEEMNAAAEVLMGMIAREAQGRTPTQTFPPQAAAASYRRLRECLEKDTAVTFEDDILLPSGERSALYTFVPIHDASGVARRIVGIAVDTTERRRAERRVRESMELFARIFSTTAQPMLITRLADDTVTEVNPAWCALFARKRAEVVGKKLDELALLPDASERDRILTALHSQRSVRNQPLRMIRGDGEVGELLYSGDVIDVHGEPSVLTSLVDITDARRAEVAIRRSQEHFEKLFRASPQPLAISGMDDGRVIDVNEIWLKTYGYAREDVVGRNFLDLGLWVDLDVRRRLRDEIRRERTVREFECRWRRKSGDIADVLLAGELIELDGEEVMLSTGLDITERKRAERLLRESEARFSKFFQSSPVPVVISRVEDGRYLEVNEAWTRFFGYPRSEVAGRTSTEFALWDNIADRELFISTLLSQGHVRNWETRYRKRSGEVADVVVSAEPLEILGERCVVSSVMDITERKHAEHQLRESERRFRDFAEAAGEYVWEIDRDARYTYLSRRVEAVIDYRPEELYGRRPFDLMPPGEAERVREVMTGALEQGNPFRNVEYGSLTRAGTLVWQLASAVPIVSSDGRITGLRGTALDITERKRAEARIEELATRDPLTGLPNRLLLSDRLAQGIASAGRAGQKLAVMFIDLDHFKAINDTLGHHVGDQLLKEVARRLAGVVRKDDTLSRLGGDEFVIVLEGLRTPEDASHIAQKILQTLGYPYVIEGHELHSAGSVGIALYPNDGEDGATLMRHADTAMYAAKSSGRKNYQFFSAEMNSRAVERLRLESALRRAAESGELRLFWQPRVEIGTGLVTGAEALLRWRHPDQGVIGPDRFMRVAEETGLVVPIGDWALNAACQQAKAWAGLADVRIPVAVNISAREFGPSLIDSVTRALGDAGLDASMLEIEVTEATLMRNPEASRAILGRLSEMGVHIVVDNFGTGYASMHSLRRFSVSAIKIDRSLVAGLAASPEDRVVVKAIIEMARSLGVTAIASGVENEEQLALLAEMGCRAYAGHHFLPAMPAPELERQLLPDSNVHTLSSRRVS